MLFRTLEDGAGSFLFLSVFLHSTWSSRLDEEGVWVGDSFGAVVAASTGATSVSILERKETHEASLTNSNTAFALTL